MRLGSWSRFDSPVLLLELIDRRGFHRQVVLERARMCLEIGRYRGGVLNLKHMMLYQNLYGTRDRLLDANDGIGSEKDARPCIRKFYAQLPLHGVVSTVVNGTYVYR